MSTFTNYYLYKVEILCADSLSFAPTCSSKLKTGDGHGHWERRALLLAVTDYFKVTG